MARSKDRHCKVPNARSLTQQLLIFCFSLGVIITCNYLQITQIRYTFVSVDDAIDNFTPKLYEVFFTRGNSVNINQDGNTENLVFSPLGLFMSLVATSMWARGSTLEEFERIMNLSLVVTSWQDGLFHLKREFKNPERNMRYEAIGKRLEQQGLAHLTPQYNFKPESMKMSTDEEYLNSKQIAKGSVNFLLVSSKYPFKLRKYTQSSLLFHSICDKTKFYNFSDPQQLSAIREKFNWGFIWSTHGMAREAIPKGTITEDTAMILSNGFYINGAWQRQYYKETTYKELFFVLENESFRVPTMHTTGEFKMAELTDLNAKAVLLLLKDEEHGLLIILPNKINGLQELEKRLLQSFATPKKLLGRMKHRNVSLALPKFRIDFNAEMSETFRQMGFVELFSPNADLSNFSDKMSSTIGTKLDLYHHAAIEVNEWGIESAIVMADFNGPDDGSCGGLHSTNSLSFVANHPFLFFLIDIKNDAIPLLAGQVTDPRPKNV